MSTGEENQQLQNEVPEINVSLVELSHLQNALIEYITESADISRANDVETWTKFYDHHPELIHLLTEHKYDATKLRNEFINFMLPIVYSMELTDDQLTRLQLFEMHPLYNRTPEGYILVSLEEQRRYCDEAKKNYRMTTRKAKPKNSRFNVAKRKLKKTKRALAKAAKYRRIVRKVQRMRQLEKDFDFEFDFDFSNDEM